MNYEKFVNTIESHLENEEIREAEALLSKYSNMLPIDQQSAPYGAALAFTGEPDSSRNESEIAVPLLNWIYQKIRNARYRQIIRRPDFKGMRIVSEGDSWFQYPAILDDIIDHISEDESFAVYSLGEAGDTISNIAIKKEYVDAIRREKPDAFLLSGGGNDVLTNGNLDTILVHYFEGANIDQLIDNAALKRLIEKVVGDYDSVVGSASRQQPSLIIYGHSYDNPQPVADGKWLGAPLQRKNIPLNIGEKVIARILQLFNKALKKLETKYQGRFKFVSLVGTVGVSANSWYDELHPKNAGFGRAAFPLIKQLKIQLDQHNEADFDKSQPREQTSVTPEIDSLDEATNITLTAVMRALNTASRGSSHSSTKVAERQRKLGENVEVQAAWEDISSLMNQVRHPDTAERRKNRESYSLISSSDMDERIINENDLDEFNVLPRGTKAGKAVGKVMIRMPDGRKGSGSGFLVGPGLLLTNNHVLPTAHIATNSEVLFDFEIDIDGMPLKPVAFEITGKVFFTSPELDFTFVSLAEKSNDGTALNKFGMLPLLPGSGKALKQERVSIIQHPGGNPKKVALRDNFVLGVARHYLYYVTDTKRGSSGSPVFNLEWQVAALHHRTVPDKTNPGQFLANRGVRISSILRYVSEASAEGVRHAISVSELVAIGRATGLHGISDSPPPPTNYPVATGFDDPRTDTGFGDTVMIDGPYAGLSIKDAVASLAKRWKSNVPILSDEGLLEENSLLTAAQARSVISDRAFKLIVDYETGGRAYYNNVLKRAATWPGGQSGVTIGFGYDLGYHSVAELERDWGSVLSTQELARYRGVIGLKGSAAKHRTPGLRDIKISFDEAERVFEARTLPKYVNITFRNLPISKLQMLHPHSVGALVSLVFNRGPSFRQSGDRYREMRAILNHLQNERFSHIPGEIRSMKRIWAGQGLNGLLRRRDDEARLFQKGQDNNEAYFEEVRFDPDNGNVSQHPENEEAYFENIDQQGDTTGSEGASIFDETAMPHLAVNHARWASPGYHPDYHHLPAATSDNVFNLDRSVVEGLIKAGAYNPAMSDHNKLIISLRGCQMVDASNFLENMSSIRLMPTTPDHEHFRCLIGVYDTVADTISLYRASTIPRRTGMLRYYNKKNFGASGSNCNMLPTGCYEHCVGTHRSASLGGIKYVLRQGDGPEPINAAQATVLRTSNDLIYGTTDVWDKTKPGDNIHPAFLSSSFSSLGCLTVYGSQQGSEAPVSTATGGWARFQKAGGFNGHNYGKRYDNLLTTGHEAATVASILATGENPESFTCLRHGSRGEAVRHLQSHLGISIDGVFGAGTKKALTQRQLASLGFATGTWYEEIAELMGLTWSH